MIVISHNLEHVFSVADRIVVLRRGRLVGAPPEAETNAALKLCVSSWERSTFRRDR